MSLLFSEKIRQTRKKQRMTIEQLAEKAGCSKSYISQLENGATKASVSMLGKLSEALNLPITDFFEENNEKLPEGAKNVKLKQNILNQSLVKKSTRKTIHYPDGKTKSHFLTRAVYQKQMQPILTTIEPGGESNYEEDTIHPDGSEEFLTVLQGEIELVIADEIVFLQEGDSFYFDGSIPHRWRNSGTVDAKVLFVWTPAVW